VFLLEPKGTFNIENGGNERTLKTLQRI